MHKSKLRTSVAIKGQLKGHHTFSVTGSNKIVWLLVVIFLPVIGFILYFLIGRNQKVKFPQ